jgi:MFS family permease
MNPDATGETAGHEPIAELGGTATLEGGERQRTRAILLLGAATFSLAVGLNMHVAMNVNYLHELLRASSWQQGYLEAIRETCGVLSFFMIAFLVGRSEPKVAAIMLALMGCGLAAYRWIVVIPQVIVFSLIWSFGFHIWAPLGSSMQLALARRGREGQTMGLFSSVGALGVLLGLSLVYVLKVFAGFGMREIFLVGGALAGLAALPLLWVPEIRAKKIDRISIRAAVTGRYRLYCSLELLDGMRRQIFLLFAVLVLVREHGVQVQNIAALMFVNQVLCIALAPLAGRLVDRVGERPVLMAYFLSIATVFIMYARAMAVETMFVIYVIDNVLFVLKVAMPTYVNRIAPRKERTQVLALGTTMNHIGAVTLPLAGGAMYALLGYRVPFYCGACVALISFLLARRIPRREIAEAAGA